MFSEKKKSACGLCRCLEGFTILQFSLLLLFSIEKICGIVTTVHLFFAEWCREVEQKACSLTDKWYTTKVQACRLFGTIWKESWYIGSLRKEVGSFRRQCEIGTIFIGRKGTPFIFYLCIFDQTRNYDSEKNHMLWTVFSLLKLLKRVLFWPSIECRNPKFIQK